MALFLKYMLRGAAAVAVIVWLGMAVLGAEGWRGEPRAPASNYDQVAPVGRITEDDLRWDCHTMGNQICGPGCHMDDAEMICSPGMVFDLGWLAS